MKHPILYHKASKGDLRQWQVWTEGPDIVTEYGAVGGKLQRSRKTAEGKNIGRANETTPEEQAELEAAALHKYKLERKYSETPEGAQEELRLPMLAHGFKGSKKSKFEYPGHVQPKLDGVRCLAYRDPDAGIQLRSRQGKQWLVPHIEAQLEEWLEEGTTLDGEIYVHGVSCQTITSWVRSADPGVAKRYKPESTQLIYHVYDVPIAEGIDDMTWGQRCHVLDDLIGSYGRDSVDLVPYYDVKDEDEVWTKHGEFMAAGYEGAILRGLSGHYKWGYRSSELLKVKQFQDAEFEVIAASEGRGKMAGCVVWTCRNDLTNGTFECTMKVPMEIRRAMYEQRENYLGKLLTVRFFDRTDDQIPRFPVGIVFRDAADLPI